MKVYLVYCHYDNGEDYDCEYTSDTVLAVTLTRENAEKYIYSLDVNDEEEDRERPWIEGNPHPWKDNENVVKHFYKKPRSKYCGYEEEIYRIEEMEVLE